MKCLDEYLKLREQIFEYFGYRENWRILPIDDSRKYYWGLDGKWPGKVRFADTAAQLESKDGDYYENEIYMQRHLPKWVYRGEEYTLIVVDTHTDGNQLLQIFDNSKERKMK